MYPSQKRVTNRLKNQAEAVTILGRFEPWRDGRSYWDEAAEHSSSAGGVEPGLNGFLTTGHPVADHHLWGWMHIPGLRSRKKI